MRTWTIHHPRLGRVEVVEGLWGELRSVDPGWPEDGEADSTDQASDTEAAGSVADESLTSESIPNESVDGQADDSTRAEDAAKSRESARAGRDRVKAKLEVRAAALGKKRFRNERLATLVADRAERCRSNAGMGCLVRIGTTVYGRYGAIEKNRSVDLDEPLADGEMTTSLIGVDKPRVRMDASGLGELVNVVLIATDGKGLFDPPANTYAERRFQAMEDSPIKRLVFPIATGLGKVSSALLVIVLAPVVSAILHWIGQFLPEIRLPKIPWPNINWPDIDLPTIRFPKIPWPDWHLPDLPDLPGWAIWLIDNPKLWVPLVVGIAIGISAFRTSRASKKSKAAWDSPEARQGGEPAESGESRTQKDAEDTRPVT